MLFADFSGRRWKGAICRSARPASATHCCATHCRDMAGAQGSSAQGFGAVGAQVGRIASASRLSAP